MHLIEAIARRGHTMNRWILLQVAVSCGLLSSTSDADTAQSNIERHLRATRAHLRRFPGRSPGLPQWLKREALPPRIFLWPPPVELQPAPPPGPVLRRLKRRL